MAVASNEYVAIQYYSNFCLYLLKGELIRRNTGNVYAAFTQCSCQNLTESTSKVPTEYENHTRGNYLEFHHFWY